MATKIVNNNIDKEYKIYCLKDPEDMSIRYIGKTQTSFSSRMKIYEEQIKQHMGLFLNINRYE